MSWISFLPCRTAHVAWNHVRLRRYLRTWIENHEEYQPLLEGFELPQQYDYEAWREGLSCELSRLWKVFDLVFET